MKVDVFTNAYSWHGQINGSKISGEGETHTNLKSGIINATGSMKGMPEGYTIAHSGASLYCISCSNSLGSGPKVVLSEGQSIIEFTGGKYTTQRKINHILNGRSVGVSDIFGHAEKTGDRNLKLDVEVNCTYEGPRDVYKVSDYVLALSISECRAFGRYVQYLHTENDVLINFVECEYLWQGPATATAAPQVQNFGIYFKDLDASDRSKELRRFGFTAQGNNLVSLADISLDRFIESLNKDV